MMHSWIWKIVAGAGAILATGAGAMAGSRTIDFEDLAVGTAVTTQYPGVTFSVPTQSCSGTPAVNLVISNITGGTSSGTKALRISDGCPDFSPDYMRMVFDRPQQEVTFTLGDWNGTFSIRAYSTTSGGTPILTKTVTIPGAGAVGVYRLVRIISGSGNIKRIEIQESVGLWEAIDDLTLYDATPPNVQISFPEYDACLCGNSVLVRGLVCDEEGYDHDQLEYVAMDAPAGTAWTLIDTATTMVCALDTPLYYWTTTGVPEGRYYLRLTAYNACGMESSAVIAVSVSHGTDAPVIRSPADAAVVGGAVSIDGTVQDEPNAACLASYHVEYRPSGSTTWNPVDPAIPVYSTSVVNDPLATWNTLGFEPKLADGKYQIRARATNVCGTDSTYVTRSLVLDNTPPVALITEPLNCSMLSGVVTIRGTVSDTHMGDWVLQYTGGDANGWVDPPIATGHTSITNGVLGTWDTTGLRRCSYTLRVVVTDTAVIGGDSNRHNQTEYLVSVYAGLLGHFDYDGDGDVDLDDFGVFQRCFSGPAILAESECRN